MLDLSGQSLLCEDVPTPTSAELLRRLSCANLDQLVLDGQAIVGEIQPKDGEDCVTLTLVRVRCNLREGLSEHLLRNLAHAGALKLPPGGPEKEEEGCLSFRVSYTDGSYVWGPCERTMSWHVLLLQDGRILAKQRLSVNDGETRQRRRRHSIAEGTFRPDESPGMLLVTWAGYATIDATESRSLPHSHLEAGRAEPLDPGAASWEKRLPLDILPVLLEAGRLNLQELCSSWASANAPTSHSVPCLTEGTLSNLGMEPANLWFWCPPVAA